MSSIGRGSTATWLLATGLGATVAVVAMRLLPRDGIQVVEGEVGNVDASGVGIDIHGEGYLIGTGLDWQGVDGSWHQGGQPECLPPNSTGAKVELGIMGVPAAEPGGGHPNHVVWLRCLTLPTEVYGPTDGADPLDGPYQRAVDDSGG